MCMVCHVDKYKITFNTLHAELNPICHLLALLGAHPVLHISRIKVKLVINSRRISRGPV